MRQHGGTVWRPILGRLGAQDGSPNRPKTAPKRLQILAQNLTSSWTPLGAVLGANLAPKTGPRRAQKSSRNELRRGSAKGKKTTTVLHFGHFFAPNLAPKTPPREVGNRSGKGLENKTENKPKIEAKMAQLRAQDGAENRPKIVSKRAQNLAQI